MVEFLQSYGGIILIAVLLLFMFRMHSGGHGGGHGGCGGIADDHREHDRAAAHGGAHVNADPPAAPASGSHTSGVNIFGRPVDTASQPEPFEDTGARGGENTQPRVPTPAHRGGCH